MTHETDHEERWFAYLLGDLPEDEWPAVEAEMAADPEAAERVRAVVDNVQGWAAAPAPYAPFHPQPTTKAAGAARLLRVPLALAAAALFVFALTNLQFSVQWGDTTFQWGAEAATEPTDTAPVPPELERRIAALEQSAAESAAAFETLAVRTIMIEDQLQYAARNLALRQAEEAYARHRDMEQVVEWSERMNQLARTARAGTP